MGIQYESVSLGGVRAEQLSGRPGVGGSQLCFSLVWSLAPLREAPIAVFGTRIWVSVATEGQRQPIALGSAEPETAWCEETRAGQSYDRHVMYRMSLPSSQMLGLEEIRQGRELIFTLDVRGNSYGTAGVRSLDEQLQLRVNVSDWCRVLRECGAGDVLLVGVHLPSGNANRAHAALDLVRAANEHLSFGHYTAAVAECRRAIESLWTAAMLAERAREARKCLSNMNGQLSMTKRDRELALGEALRVFCHVAHHVGSNAEPEMFGRLDAALAVSTAAALVSSLASDPDLMSPNSLGTAQPSGGGAAKAPTPDVANTKVKTAKADSAPALAVQVLKVREFLKNNSENRPGTLKKLRSALDSLFAKALEPAGLDRLLKELIKQNVVKEEAGKLIYGSNE